MCCCGSDSHISHYRGRLVALLSITSIVVQVLAISFNVGTFVLDTNPDRRGHSSHGTFPNPLSVTLPALSCGVFILLAASIGIAAGVTKRRGLIIAHLVLVTLGCVFSGVYLLTSIGNVLIESLAITLPRNTLLAFLIISQLVLALIQFPVVIATCSFSCRVICCHGNQESVVDDGPGTVQLSKV